MKLHITVLASSLALAMPALAKDIPLSQAESIAKSVTPDSASVAFNDLEAQWLTQLRKALQGDTAALTRDAMAQMRQNSIQADNAWLQASGYDFHTTENQQMGITLLSAFNTLPEAVLKDNLATVTAINHDADVNTRHQALAQRACFAPRRQDRRVAACCSSIMARSQDVKSSCPAVGAATLLIFMLSLLRI